MDTICCKVVNYPPLSLCTNQAARRLGVGVSDLDAIELVGDPIESVEVHDFLIPNKVAIFFSLPHLAKSCLKSWRAALAPD